MQLFVRGWDGRTVLLSMADGRPASTVTVGDVALKLEALLGVPPSELLLGTQGGRPLRPGVALQAQGVTDGATLQANLRIKGGKPVKVKLLAPAPLPGVGAEVTVDMETDTPMAQVVGAAQVLAPVRCAVASHVYDKEVKRQLAQATGVPVEHQKVMLAGIGSVVMLDKRCNIGYSHCGSTNNLYFATLASGGEAPAAASK